MKDQTSDKTRESYQQFLEERHSGFNTPIEVIKTAVQKATHSVPTESEKIIAGEINEVYSIKTQDGNEVIVRISHREKPRFKAEKFALDKARDTGVPTPKVLLIDQDICVEEKLPGEQLSRLPSDGSDERTESLVSKAGSILSKIHSVEVDGFGWLDEKGKGFLKTWEDYMLQDLEKRDFFTKIAIKHKLDPIYIKRAFELLIKHRRYYSGIKPKLIHGDFSPKHLLVEDSQITGVVDMEDCKGGDIARDFAWWEYFHGDRFPIEWLMKGYDSSEVLTKEFRIRMNLCRLQMGVTLLYWYDYTQNQNGINHVREKLVEDVSRF